MTCEYHDEEGEVLKMFVGAGELISPTSVFFGAPSCRRYTSYTDCEVNKYYLSKAVFNCLLVRCYVISIAEDSQGFQSSTGFVISKALL